MAPLFVLSPTAQIIVCVIGAATALLSAFIALTQTDLKRVLAYSTVSQLGYMFMALGTSGAVTPSIAVGAAIFHLFTHAFFKALLFLGSGSVMHAMGNVIDMRRFGGLRKIMPVTHATFLCGSAALAGLPILSGFWSKDQILACLDEASEHAFYWRGLYFGIFGVALLTAFLTAFYTFRAYFLTFWGEERVPEESGHHAHESPRGMRVPLIVLAVGAVLVGLICDPLTHGFSHFLDETPMLHTADKLYAKKFNATPATHTFHWALAGISTVVAGCGVGLAYLLYGRGQVAPVPAGLAPLHGLSRNKAYVDELYAATIVSPAEGLAAGTKVFDGAIDGFARLFALIPKGLGSAVKPLQNGLVQFYALGMVLGVGVFVSFIVFRVRF
jgi:NADH:ubiquinone oxidoreductase subunit 5 (subunit L)/multisubunit Na+/H+ antiporter MnhA subunit